MNKEKIIYVYDPLCGWCYGQSEHLRSFAQTLKQEVRVIPGGMVPKERANSLKPMADYLKSAQKRVTELSGAEFSQEFADRLEDEDFILNSDVAGAAQSLFNHLYPQRQMDFAAAIQKKLYKGGLNISEESVVFACLEELEVDLPAFKALWDKGEANKRYQADLQLVKGWGIQGFPAILVERDSQLSMIAHGFLAENRLMENYQQVPAA